MVACCCLAKDVRVIIQGQKESGKTSLLYRLSLGKFATNIPACPLYDYHCGESSGFIYMIDSQDTDTLENTLNELINLILNNVDIKDKPVMVLANKQDLPNVISAQNIEEALKEKCLIHSEYFVRPCSVKTGEGIHEAFREFLQLLQDKS